MIIDILFKHIKDKNELGEALRSWCFVGRGTGCYSNFDLREGFMKLEKSSEMAQKLTQLIDYEEGYGVLHIYHHPEENVYIAWYWDGDGTLLIGSEDNWVINDDCKKDYTWKKIKPRKNP